MNRDGGEGGLFTFRDCSIAQEIARSFPGVLSESKTSIGAPGVENAPTRTTFPGRMGWLNLRQISATWTRSNATFWVSWFGARRSEVCVLGGVDVAQAPRTQRIATTHVRWWVMVPVGLTLCRSALQRLVRRRPLMPVAMKVPGCVRHHAHNSTFEAQLELVRPEQSHHPHIKYSATASAKSTNSLTYLGRLWSSS